MAEEVDDGGRTTPPAVLTAKGQGCDGVSQALRPRNAGREGAEVEFGAASSLFAAVILRRKKGSTKACDI